MPLANQKFLSHIEPTATLFRGASRRNRWSSLCIVFCNTHRSPPNIHLTRLRQDLLGTVSLFHTASFTASAAREYSSANWMKITKTLILAKSLLIDINWIDNAREYDVRSSKSEGHHRLQDTRCRPIRNLNLTPLTMAPTPPNATHSGCGLDLRCWPASRRGGRKPPILSA